MPPTETGAWEELRLIRRRHLSDPNPPNSRVDIIPYLVRPIATRGPAGVDSLGRREAFHCPVGRTVDVVQVHQSSQSFSPTFPDTSELRALISDARCAAVGVFLQCSDEPESRGAALPSAWRTRPASAAALSASSCWLYTCIRAWATGKRSGSCLIARSR